MATKLTKPVSREVQISDSSGNKGDALVTMTPEGIEIRGKGTKRVLKANWAQLEKAVEVHSGVPAKFGGNPFDWLIETQTQAKPASEATT